MGKRTGRPKGRPLGSKNKRTAERERALSAVAGKIEKAIPKAFSGDSHALLMAVYKDPSYEIPLRLDAARAAIRYEKPSLCAIEHTGKDGAALFPPTLTIQSVAAAKR